MNQFFVQLPPLPTDPDIEVGGILTLERADGRSVWRQRLVCTERAPQHYIMRPCDEQGRPLDSQGRAKGEGLIDTLTNEPDHGK